jgi:hypothetical protein
MVLKARVQFCKEVILNDNTNSDLGDRIRAL